MCAIALFAFVRLVFLACKERLEIEAVAFYSMAKAKVQNQKIREHPNFTKSIDFCRPLLQSCVRDSALTN